MEEIERPAVRSRADESPIQGAHGQQIAALLDTSERFDPDRLHQEAILIATKADIREELDRLAPHVSAGPPTHSPMAAPVGRRLDFLAQEFNREVNTLCSKSERPGADPTGLDLKTVVDQFRRADPETPE